MPSPRTPNGPASLRRRLGGGVRELILVAGLALAASACAIGGTETDGVSVADDGFAPLGGESAAGAVGQVEPLAMGTGSGVDDEAIEPTTDPASGDSDNSGIFDANDGTLTAEGQTSLDTAGELGEQRNQAEGQTTIRLEDIPSDNAAIDEAATDDDASQDDSTQAAGTADGAESSDDDSSTTEDDAATDDSSEQQPAAATSPSPAPTSTATTAPVPQGPQHDVGKTKRLRTPFAADVTLLNVSSPFLGNGRYWIVADVSVANSTAAVVRSVTPALFSAQRADRSVVAATDTTIAGCTPFPLHRLDLQPGDVRRGCVTFPLQQPTAPATIFVGTGGAASDVSFSLRGYTPGTASAPAPNRVLGVASARTAIHTLRHADGNEVFLRFDDVKDNAAGQAHAGSRLLAIRASISNSSTRTFRDTAATMFRVVDTTGRAWTGRVGVRSTDCGATGDGAVTVSPQTAVQVCVTYELPAGVRIAGIEAVAGEWRGPAQWGLS